MKTMDESSTCTHKSNIQCVGFWPNYLRKIDDIIYIDINFIISIKNIISMSSIKMSLSNIQSILFETLNSGWEKNYLFCTFQGLESYEFSRNTEDDVQENHVNGVAPKIETKK